MVVAVLKCLRKLPLFGLSLLLAAPASAAELTGHLGTLAAKSAWAGDLGGGFQVALGARWLDWIGTEVLVWEQLSAVDQRVNTGLTLGITATLPRDGVRPGLRLFVLHQHEEGLVSVRDHPWGTLAGIGAGIRHRAGTGLDLRAELPWQTTRLGDLHGRAGLTGVWFPDSSLGPAWYLALSVEVGLNFMIVGQ